MGRLRQWYGPIASLLFACSCSDIGRQRELRVFVDQVYAGRDPINVVVERTPGGSIEYRLPDYVTPFELTSPRTMGSAGPPTCEIAIADDVDDAIHRFGVDGTYRGTLFSRRPSPFTNIASLALDSARVWISYLASPRLAIVGRDGELIRQFEIPRLSDSMVPRSQLTPARMGTVVEHWLGSGLATWSAAWGRALPLVRWLSDTGTVLASAGGVEPVPGRTMTAALNRGYVAYAQDTAWFAHAADARVYGVPIGDLQGGWSADTVLLPVSFRMRPPVEETNEAGVRLPRVEYHVTAFAVSPSGETFAFGHVLGWPDPRDPVLFQPTTVLGVYDRTRVTFRAFDVGGMIFEVHLTSRRVATVLLWDLGEHRRVVRTFRLSPSEPGEEPSCLTGPR